MADVVLITRRSGVRSAPRAAVASSQDLLIDRCNDPLIVSSLYRRSRRGIVGSSLQSRELLAKEGVASSNLVFRSNLKGDRESVREDSLYHVQNHGQLPPPKAL